MSTKKIHVTSIEPSETRLFIQAACGLPAPSESGFCVLLQQEIQLSELPIAKVDSADLETDGVVLLAEHLDMISVEQLRRVGRSIIRQQGVPLLITIFRKKDQREFKISCLQCGQKLLLNDDAVGKKADCVRCKTRFVIPSQEGYARAVMGTIAEVTVTVQDQQHTIVQALSGLLSQERPAAAIPVAEALPDEGKKAAAEGGKKVAIKRKS